MSKLFKLKEWVTLSDAAKHLSITFAEEVTEADVLRLGLDNRLILSVNFVNNAVAMRCKVIPFSEARMADGLLFEGEEPYKVCLDYPLNDREVLQTDEKVVSIEGVWDLLMIGGERLNVESQYQRLVGGVDVDLINTGGSFVKGASGQICQIQTRVDGDENFKGEPKFKRWNHPDRFRRAECLPEDSDLVVRTGALREFEASINSTSGTVEKPLTTKERNTLLAIIAALAKEAKIDLSKPSKAGETIARLTEIIGAPVDHSTIEQKIKLIDDALERRAK